VECREQGEREASPTAAIIDSQSVKSAEKGGPALIRMAMMRAKKIKGKKRHILVDTLGLLLHAIVPISRTATAAFCFLRHCSGCIRS
jgi:putative transposase